jgi:NADH dehydrogenase FAD-containing subunit
MTSTSVKEVKENSVLLETTTTSEGSEATNEFDLDADIVVCTSGMMQTELISKLPLEKDAFGRIAVTKSLQSVSNPNVFAIGDCSSVIGMPLPSTAQVAMQQSAVLAENLKKRSKYLQEKHDESLHASPSKDDEFIMRRMDKFSYVPLGEMLTLGSLNAAISGLNENVQLAGPLAALTRRLVYSFRMPGKEQKAKALIAAGVVSVANAIKSIK